MPRARWKLNAQVLAWPLGDQPPYLARIVGEAMTMAGEDLVVIASEHGSSAVLPEMLSSAAPVVRALKAGVFVQYGHC